MADPALIPRPRRSERRAERTALPATTESAATTASHGAAASQGGPGLPRYLRGGHRRDAGRPLRTAVGHCDGRDVAGNTTSDVTRGCWRAGVRDRSRHDAAGTRDHHRDAVGDRLHAGTGGNRATHTVRGAAATAARVGASGARTRTGSGEDGTAAGGTRRRDHHTCGDAAAERDARHRNAGDHRIFERPRHCGRAGRCAHDRSAAARRSSGRWVSDWRRSGRRGSHCSGSTCARRGTASRRGARRRDADDHYHRGCTDHCGCGRDACTGGGTASRATRRGCGNCRRTRRGRCGAARRAAPARSTRGHAGACGNHHHGRG